MSQASRNPSVWGGAWFVNVGMDDPKHPPLPSVARPYNRHWDLCRRHGYLCAGGGPVYSNPFYELATGDRLFAFQRGAGYVGYGEVIAAATVADRLVLASGQTLGQTLDWPGLNPSSQDSELWEHAIGVKWFKTFPLDEAKGFGLHRGYRLTACRPRKVTGAYAFLCQQFDVV